jgi:oxygen-independent coproporphyrinogen-3 oxidase
MPTLTQDILAKYDVAGPRYTSYPTAPEWKSTITGEDYAKHLTKCGHSQDPISLYIHIPFCQSLCTYCGCNVAIRKHWPKYGDEYLDHLEQELKLVSNHLGTQSKVQQLHWGGGTPTFLNAQQLERLFRLCESHFELDFQGEIAIELEPRTVSLEQIQLLKKLGFNRVSMGVQDFDPKVQQAINRVHDEDAIKKVTDQCRSVGFESINMDLIYGLPHQTQDSFEQTVQKVKDIQPNRIALYSFAHLPGIMKQQRKIDADTLPDSEEKLNIFLNATRDFLDESYEAIAMDHFALKDDEMAIAFREGNLSRNFMGYTLLPTQHFIGLGSSSIGYVAGAYFQNIKSLPEYYQKVQNSEFPLERGLILSEDDLLRQDIINRFMCHFKLNRNEFKKDYGKTFEDMFPEEQQHIRFCIEDGLLTDDGQCIEVTELGKLFVRNIAMGFDIYLRNNSKKKRFSKVI